MTKMEEGLLLPRDKDQRKGSWRLFFQEVKMLSCIAGPMVAVNLSQLLLQIVSMMMVGHLGGLALSSTAIATSLAAVTGFSLFSGLASALETLCGQAYGAEKYQKHGIQTYTAIFSLNLVCIPISLIWFYMKDLLIFMGQDPSISQQAGKFIVLLIPALFACATLQPLIRYFQTQSLIMPMLLCSCVTLMFHIPLCWILVFKSGLDNLGGALAISISYWLNTILLGLYMKFSSACSKTRAPISREVFQGIGEFFRFAVPSAVMLCLQWWSFELLILLSGLLPNPTLETSVLSVWKCNIADTNMEESLCTLPKEANDSRNFSSTSTTTSLTWAYFFIEVKRQCYIAGPMVAVILSQNLLRVVSMMMVGHLGELALCSTSIAISLSGVTGFSVFIGMASGLETICGQAYGAKQYQKLGLQTYTAIISLNLVCLPLSLLWIYMEDLLIFMGQDPLISREAGKFTIWLIPALFAYATLQPLIRYFQTQSLITPMLLSSCATLLFHIPLCWVLVFKSGLDNLGGALAISISYWLNVILLVLFMKYSSACSLTRAPVTKDVFHGMREFFYFAIPSTVMICVEWWSFELLILLSGLLPNPALETSVLSVCLQTISTLYAIPYGFGAAASTRVANELGAGNSEGARIAAQVALLLAVTETSIETTTLFALRHSYGYTFSNEKQVIDYVTSMAPLVCLSLALDSLQGVLTGIARGCGWQHIGAYINLGSFYLCGIPVAAILAFWLELRGRGLWIGIQLGSLLQTIFLSFVTTCTNWEMQASKARERVFQGGSSGDAGFCH